LYLFSAYAPQLATELALTATNISLVGMIGNLGMAFSGPVAGSLVDKRGPTIPLIIGACFIFMGYSITRIAYLNRISSVKLLGSALLLVGSGSTFAFSALVKCAALNFPSVRGLATSVPMAAFGLSAFFLSTIASIVVPGNTYGLLCLLSFLPTSLFIVSIYFVRFLPPQYVSLNRGSVEMRDIKRRGTPGIQNAPSSMASMPVSHGDGAIELNGLSLLRTRLFWGHFVVLGLLAGTGQMYIYSCGYCVRALVSNPDSNIETLQSFQSLQVGIISLTSFTGRISSGIISDYIGSRYGMPRTLLLWVAAVVSLIAQLLALYVSEASGLWKVSAATGLSYGICYGSYPTIISDAFGMKNFSQNWGILSLSPVPISYLLNMLFGVLYDLNSTIDEFGHRVCDRGNGCYSNAFLITVVAAGLSSFVLIPCMMLMRK
jgi:MFS family permease